MKFFFIGLKVRVFVIMNKIVKYMINIKIKKNDFIIIFIFISNFIIIFNSVIYFKIVGNFGLFLGGMVNIFDMR